MPSASLTGNMYFIIFTDEFTRYKRVYSLKTVQSKDVLRAIAQCITDQVDKLGYKPDKLHSDLGTCFTAKEVQDYLTFNQIKFETSTAKNHEQNGIAEKAIQDVMNISRSIMIEAKAPNRLWAEAVANSIYTTNRTYKQSLNKTPYEAYLNKKPHIGHMRKFLSPVWVHVYKDERNKLDKRAVEMKFVGYTQSDLIFRVIDKSLRTVKVETNVHFIKQQTQEKEEERVSIFCPQNLKDLFVFRSPLDESDNSDSASSSNYPILDLLSI